ncbi:MAG: hypothetical protein GY719_06150 [bacterium]|nr:hypothetical protein [bacterium]
MSDEPDFQHPIHDIHRALEQAEYALTRLGKDLQFLVRLDGTLQVVRRTETGGTAQPKVVLTDLPGADPALWQPELPSWLQVLSTRDSLVVEIDVSMGADPQDPVPGGGEAGDGASNGTESETPRPTAAEE